MKGMARDSNAVEGFFLRRRSCPLHEADAVMPTGVPGAGTYLNLTVGAESIQIVIDEDRTDLRFLTLHSFQQWAIQHAPEISFVRNIAEPTSVLSIGARRHERRKLAMFNSFVNFPHKPTMIGSCDLRVRQPAVAHHDDDFLAIASGNVRPIS